MRRAFLSAILFSAVVLTTVMSCTKSSTSPSPVTPVASLNSQFTAFRSAPQTFSIPAGIDTTVFGAEGTVLRFYKNTFVNGSGDAIHVGTVTLLLTEIYTPGDMISNRVTTMMASGEVLQSCGEINVSATMGGQPVYSNGYGIGFKQHDTSVQLMTLFYAATSANDSMTIWTQTDVAYIHGAKPLSTTEVINDTLRTVIDTCFFFDNFHAFTTVNCNWFTTPTARRAGVSVILPDGSFNANNTQLYLVLPKTNTGWTGNSVISNIGDLGQYDSTYVPATNTLWLKTVGDTAIAPVGLKYELVAIANKGGKYYYWANAGVVPDSGIRLNAALIESRQDSIVSWLKGL